MGFHVSDMMTWACAASAFLSRKKTKRRRSCREKESHYSSDGPFGNKEV